MTLGFIKVTNISLEDYLRENPNTSTKPFILKNIFYCDVLPKNESYKAFDYFLTEVRPEAEAIVNYENTRFKEIPDYIAIEEDCDLKNSVYVEVSGQAIIPFEWVTRRKIFH